MFLTCDSKAKMGYIYLKQPNENNPIWNEENFNLGQYLDNKVTEIPVGIDNVNILKGLKNLIVSSKTYLDDLDTVFTEEWLNDKQENGCYITGIELSLTEEEFINSIKNKAYRLYEVEYLEKRFLFLTLDNLDNVLEPNNIIYPANKNKDVYYITAIEDEICYIKGILSNRPDIYDLQYLKDPKFILY